MAAHANARAILQRNDEGLMRGWYLEMHSFVLGHDNTNMAASTVFGGFLAPPFGVAREHIPAGFMKMPVRRVNVPRHMPRLGRGGFTSRIGRCIAIAMSAIVLIFVRAS